MARDPTVELLSLFKDKWTVSNTSLAEPPEFHTGWYSRDGSMPALTLTGGQEGPIRGGEIGYTALSGGDGYGMQRLSGFVLVDAVAGTRTDCEGVGTNGTDLNPKKVRWEMYDEATRILIENQTATTLRALAPRGGQTVTDGGEDVDIEPVFRHQFRAGYIRDREP